MGRPVRNTIRAFRVWLTDDGEDSAIEVRVSEGTPYDAAKRFTLDSLFGDACSPDGYTLDVSVRDAEGDLRKYRVRCSLEIAVSAELLDMETG